jgi:integrase
MQGEHALLARLLYGTGMRINEALQWRVKDVDFAHQALIVREGKGGKDRVLMLAQSLAQPLRDQVRRFARQHRSKAPHTSHAAPLLRDALATRRTISAQFRTCSDTRTWQRP